MSLDMPESRGFRKIMRTIGIVRPLLPFIMIGIGSAIPLMRVPVGVPTTDGLWIAVVIEILLAGIWLGAEIVTVVDRNTKVSHLQWDDFSSLIVSLILTAWWGQMVATGRLQWWFVIPWVAAIIDAILSGYLAINNAAQKPLVQGPRG